MSDNLYVILKLTSGEQVMAVLREEDEQYVMLEDPMCIKMIPVLETGREHVIANPLCHFTDDTTYVIPKQSILFVKRLQSSFVPHYLKLVEQHNDHSFVPREEKNAEQLDWGDEEPTPEEARKMIKQLKNVFEEEKEEEVDWKEKLKNLVPGNDTIN